MPKERKYGAVRCWKEPKERLERLTAMKALQGQRVTEVEQTSKAINDYCDREQRKLGIEV